MFSLLTQPSWSLQESRKLELPERYCMRVHDRRCRTYSRKTILSDRVRFLGSSFQCRYLNFLHGDRCKFVSCCCVSLKDLRRNTFPYKIFQGKHSMQRSCKTIARIAFFFQIVYRRDLNKSSVLSFGFADPHKKNVLELSEEEVSKLSRLHTIFSGISQYCKRHVIAPWLYS